jgi:hypothetical protein
MSEPQLTFKLILCCNTKPVPGIHYGVNFEPYQSTWISPEDKMENSSSSNGCEDGTSDMSSMDKRE